MKRKTLNSVISKGLDISSKSKSAPLTENTSIEHTLVKQELPDTVPADVAKEKQPKRLRRELIVKLHKTCHR